MSELPSIAAYIKADSQNDANMQYRKIIRYINEVLPGGTCFFFCDHGTKVPVEFNRFLYLAGKKKFTHLVTCNNENLPGDVISLLHLTGVTLATVHENSFIQIFQYKKRPESI